MAGGARGPTPYPEINAVLAALRAGVQGVLGGRCVGVYVHGSLAGGDFDPASSDIDFLVVTAGALPPTTPAELQAMHARLAADGGPWARRMEGSYIPRAALRRYDPTDCHHPALRFDGSFDIDEHGPEWVIQRHVLREAGLALAGPPPRTLIDPVVPDDLRRATLGTLRGWWRRQLADPALLVRRHYQAYAVLTMCRALYTLTHGTVVSKPVAARWARAELGAPWAAQIERALLRRSDEQPDGLDDTLAFIRFTLARAEQFAIAAGG
jgi:hypothetical protein